MEFERYNPLGLCRPPNLSVVHGKAGKKDAFRADQPGATSSWVVRGWRGRRTLTRPQRTVPRRSQSERRSEGSREVRLIGESRVERDLDERALPVNLLPCEFEAAHEQIAVGAGPQHDPELPRQIVACQSRDRLQLS